MKKLLVLLILIVGLIVVLTIINLSSQPVPAEYSDIPKPVPTQVEEIETETKRDVERKMIPIATPVKPTGDPKDKGLKIKGADGKVQYLDEQEIQEFQHYFVSTYENWTNEMKSLLEGEFGLGEEGYRKYEEIKEEYQESLAESFEDMLDQMEEQGASEEELINFQMEGKYKQTATEIREQFQQKLENFMGSTNYRRYQETMEDFNNRIKDERGSKAFVKIDF